MLAHTMCVSGGDEADDATGDTDMPTIFRPSPTTTPLAWDAAREALIDAGPLS